MLPPDSEHTPNAANSQAATNGSEPPPPDLDGDGPPSKTDSPDTYAAVSDDIAKALGEAVDEQTRGDDEPRQPKDDGQADDSKGDPPASERTTAGRGKQDKPGDSGSDGETAAPDDDEPDDDEKKAWSDKTRQRFERLTTDRRELRDENERLGSELNATYNLFQQTGAAPDELRLTFDTVRMAKSGDPAQQEQAFQNALQFARNIGLAIGKEIDADALNPLAAFPDLVEAVENMEIDEGRAREIARYRSQGRQQQEQAQRYYQNQQQQQMAVQRQQAEQEEVTRALEAVSRAEAEFSKKDLSWGRKADQMREFAVTTLVHFPRPEWEKRFRAEYQRLSKFMDAVQPQRAPHHNGLRPGATSTNRATPDVKDPHEAVRLALENQ